MTLLESPHILFILVFVAWTFLGHLSKKTPAVKTGGRSEKDTNKYVNILNPLTLNHQILIIATIIYRRYHHHPK